MPDYVLESLRGGLDDFTPSVALPENACTVAENVEFHKSMLGERRAGSAVADLPVGITGNANLYGVVWACNHQPLGLSSSAELWVMTFDRVAGVIQNPLLFRRTSAGWSSIAFPSANDTPIGTFGYQFKIYGQSLHGKLFISYLSAVNRLHVWDGTSLRRVGLAANAVPTVADTGAGAYAAVLRYYRTRSVKRTGAVVNVRSEPSPSVAFTPSGAGTASRVTRAALPGESETDWEVEASLDNVIFYKLATVAAATTTYDDSSATTTYSSNTQSDPIGTYTLIPSVQFLSTDGDRLVMGSNNFNEDGEGSTLRWSPVGNDPSPGPDERLNSSTDPRLDLDSLEGGNITGISANVSGSYYVFKSSHIYRVNRTGQLVGAYDATPMTKERGAIPHSIVATTDEVGRTCIYFIDPSVGFMRIGPNGPQCVGTQLRTTFGRLNPSAVIGCHGVSYTRKSQLHYWLALDNATYPTSKVVLQTNLAVTTEMGDTRGGWSTVATNDGIAVALCSVMFAADITTGDIRQVPFIGRPSGLASLAATKALFICDIGTTDDSVVYVPRVRSRPLFFPNILCRHGVLASSMVLTTETGDTGGLTVNLIRDFGQETLATRVAFDLTTQGDPALRQLDDVTSAEMCSTQIEFTDDALVPTQWQVQQFAMRVSPEQTV